MHGCKFCNCCGKTGLNGVSENYNCIGTSKYKPIERIDIQTMYKTKKIIRLIDLYKNVFLSKVEGGEGALDQWKMINYR